MRLPSAVNGVLSREDRATTTVSEVIADDRPAELSSWLGDAQKTFLDMNHLATSSALTGKLYSQCNKKIDEKSFAHRDARLLSRAYKDSLDAKKHSLAIGLPPDLRNEIKETKLRGLIEINSSPSATDNGDDDYDGTEAEDDGSNCDADAESDLFDDSGADGLESCSSMDTDSEEYYY